MLMDESRFDIVQNQQWQMRVRSHFSCKMLLDNMTGIPGDHREQSCVSVFGQIKINSSYHIAGENGNAFTFYFRFEKRKEKVTIHSFHIRKTGFWGPDTHHSYFWFVDQQGDFLENAKSFFIFQ